MIGIVQKCLHGLVKTPSTQIPKEGRGAFSGVTGGRAPSFHDLSVGEALAPSEGEGNSGGGKFPSQISHRKEQPGRLGTEGKVPRPSHECFPVNTFERC